jgi:hypothetical protein
LFKIWLISITEIDIAYSYIYLLFINQNLSVMKTLKIFVALCIMLGFANNAVNAQAQTSKYTYTWYHWVPCTGEESYGDLTVQYMINDNKYIYTFSGRLIGRVTGNVYTFRETYTYDRNDNINNSQEVHRTAYSFLIHCNGRPIGRADGTFHTTFNAKGEITANFGEWTDMQCL